MTQVAKGSEVPQRAVRVRVHRLPLTSGEHKPFDVSHWVDIGGMQFLMLSKASMLCNDGEAIFEALRKSAELTPEAQQVCGMLIAPQQHPTTSSDI